MTDVTDDRDVTVLVVDDEPDLVSLYTVWLDDSYDVRSATGGEEALDELDDSVSVALLDRRMPGMTGDEILDAIRARGVDCQVAMITAVEPDIDVVDMPFDDYLVKPIDKHGLRSTVEVLVRRRDYDQKSQEFFRLAAKRAAIEGADGDHTGDPEYRDLVDRMERLRASIDTTLDELGPEGYEAAFQDLD